MRIRIHPTAAFLLLSCLLAGCGGGDHNNSPAAVRSGKATFVVHWPKRTTRLIPVASNSIRVDILRNGTQVATQLLQRPDGDTTQATFDPLPVDNLVVVATAFPNSDGTGIAQAKGNASLVILSGANTTINLTMGTTITSIAVGPPATLVYGVTQTPVTLIASAMDADNNVVLTSGTTFSWATDNGKIVGISPSGATATLSAAGIGVTQVRATETESNVSGQVQIKVRGTGVLATTWAKFRSNPNNTGSFGATGLGGTVNWSMSTGGPVESSPVVAADGTVYIGSGDGFLYALSPSNGNAVWKTFIGGHLKSTPVLGTDGTIYIASTNGQIVALDKSDGSQKWIAGSFNTAYNGSPTIGRDGNLYIGGDDGTVRSLDGASGDLLWTTGFTGAIESSPALSMDGSTIYLGGGDGQMHAVRTTDGQPIWSFQTGGAVQSSPLLDSMTGALFFGSDDGKVYAVSAADGSPFWTQPATTGGIVSSSPTMLGSPSGAVIVVGSSDGKVYAFAAANGTSVATPFQTGGSVRSSPAVGQNGTIVVGSDDGFVYGLFLNFTTQAFFQQQFFFKSDAGVSSSPSLANGQFGGVIYVGSTDSKIYSLISGG